MRDLPLLPTTIVGSHPQPNWLIDRERLKASVPPRVRAETLWRIPSKWLGDAQEAATLMAIRYQEELGIDIIGDGVVEQPLSDGQICPRIARKVGVSGHSISTHSRALSSFPRRRESSDALGAKGCGCKQKLSYPRTYLEVKRQLDSRLRGNDEGTAARIASQPRSA